MSKFITLSICCWLLIACESYSQKTSLDPQGFESALSEGKVQLLDVRTAKEYQSGHLKNALQADWNNQQDFKERTAHLDKDKPVFVYCAAGSRSAAAAEWLISQGYNVTELKGGFIGWKSANKPIEQASNEKPISLAEYKVLTNLGPVVLVDIGAEWCPPCKKMEPVLDQLKKDLGENVKIVKIDAGAQTELMKQLNAEKIPTFIIYKNGGETWRKAGIVDIKELKQNLN